MLRGRCTNQELIRAICNYIMDGEDRDSILNELKRYKREFFSEPDYNWYSYGNILPYYSQIREFYAKNNIPANDNNDILLEHFKAYVGKAIDLLLEGYKVK